MESTTRKEVFAEAEAEILRSEGAKAAAFFVISSAALLQRHSKRLTKCVPTTHLNPW